MKLIALNMHMHVTFDLMELMERCLSELYSNSIEVAEWVTFCCGYTN